MNNIYDVYRIPTYDTKLFCEIYDNANSFVTDYKTSGLYNESNKITDENAALLFYLLYAKHGNDPIANLDINQFKYKIWSIIFQYGPTWEKRLDIQEKLRGLSEKEMMQGAKSISNMALNPDQEPDESQIDELKELTKFVRIIKAISIKTIYNNNSKNLVLLFNLILEKI